MLKLTVIDYDYAAMANVGGPAVYRTKDFIIDNPALEEALKPEAYSTKTISFEIQS